MTQFLIISSDCHAGALPETYNQYMPEEYREAARARAKPKSQSEKLKPKGNATGNVDCTRSDEPRSERTRRDDQKLLVLANELPLPERKRYLSMFFPDRSCFT